jgi:hypothetical protein
MVRVVITSAIHLTWCAIWRGGVFRALKMIVGGLQELLNATRGSLVLAMNLHARLTIDG